MRVPFKPEGYHSVTPYLALRDAKAAIDFYARAFGAELVLKLDLPDGSIAHAEVRIGSLLKPLQAAAATARFASTPIRCAR